MPKYFVNRTTTLYRPPNHGGKVLVGGTAVELTASEAEEAGSAVQQIRNQKSEVGSQKTASAQQRQDQGNKKPGGDQVTNAGMAVAHEGPIDSAKPADEPKPKPEPRAPKPEPRRRRS